MSGSSRRTFLLSGFAVPAACAKSDKAAPVRYRTLGKTGLKVTELGFGSEAVSDVTVFERALDAGINFFDTARGYEGGNAERALGAALRKRRNTVVLATRSYAGNARQAALDLDASLKALGTDHVDIWYLGQKDRPGQITPDMLEMQRAAQKAGKLRFRGVSTHRLGNILKVVLDQQFDVVQIPYSFAVGTRRDPYKTDTTNLESSLDSLKAAGIGVVAMKVMAGGYRNPDGRGGAPVAAIRWALRDDRVQTTSVRMTDAEQLDENLRAMLGRYSPDDAKRLAAYTDAVSPVLCRMCGACDGKCPNGVLVSDVVRSVMYAEAYGQFEQGRSAYEQSAASSGCGACARCSVICPNGVRLGERMDRARQLFC